MITTGTQFNQNDLRKKLLKKTELARKKIYKNHPHLQDFLLAKETELKQIRATSTQVISLAALSASLFLSPSSESLKLPIPKEIIEKLKTQKSQNPESLPQQMFTDILSSLLPDRPQPLTKEEEEYLENLTSGFFALKAKTTLEGQHLNTCYGLIGAEQHLPRYPEDTLAQHGDSGFLLSGMTSGKGAWGYFAPSKQEITPELIETEKWYAVVQTIYLPDWNTDTHRLYNWYKYRKVLILNTLNGKAVVARIADAGPAAWTGKSFGGSPEVMDALGGKKYKKGLVAVFFVDDPQNQIPLGPRDYNRDITPLNLSN